MKHLTLAALAVLGLTFADAPRFAPEDKSSVEKTIRSDVKLSATDFKMSMDGRDIPKEMLGEVVMTFAENTKLVLTDRYVKSKDGRPLELDRTFDELVQTKRDVQKMPGMEEEQVEEEARASALESKTVRFTWNAKSEEYDTKFAGEEGNGDLLEGLVEDLDFRALLPDGDAKVGDTWKLDGKKFNHLLDIGGDLHFESTKEKSKDDNNDFSSQIDENMTGEAEVTFEEVREKDGKRLALITFKADFKSHAKMNEGTMDADVVLEPEGELLWDLEANRMHSLEVKGKVAISVKGDQAMGEEHNMHIEIEMEGTMGIEVAIK